MSPRTFSFVAAACLVSSSSLACNGSEPDPSPADTEGTQDTEDTESPADTEDPSTASGDTSGGGSSTGVDGSTGDDTGTETGEETTGGPAGGPLLEEWRVHAASGSTDALCLFDDGRAVFVGTDSAPFTSGPAYVQAVSADGMVEWNTPLDESTVNALYDVACSDDGNVYAVGLTGTNLGLSDPWIVKLDATSGVVQWMVQLTAPDLYGSFHGVEVDAQGVYVSGDRNTMPGGNRNTHLAHYDTDGNELWSRTGPEEGVYLDLMRIDGSILAVGEQQFLGGAFSLALVSVFELGAEHVWSQTWEYPRSVSRAAEIAEGPGGELWVSTVRETTPTDGELLVWSCDVDACAPAPQSLADRPETDGLVIDDTGLSIVSRMGDIEAYDGAGLVWSQVTDLTQAPSWRRTNLARDAAGALYLAAQDGGEPALAKFVPDPDG